MEYIYKKTLTEDEGMAELLANLARGNHQSAKLKRESWREDWTRREICLVVTIYSLSFLVLNWKSMEYINKRELNLESYDSFSISNIIDDNQNKLCVLFPNFILPKSQDNLRSSSDG